MADLPEKLLAGYRSYMAEHLADERQQRQILAAEGQQPETMVIACCDSRAVPENIFTARSGELFVMRNIANQVPPFQPDGEYHGTSAAIEYAVQALKVKHIVVLGHGHCGGVNTALNQDFKPLSSDDFIGRWMGLLAPAAESIGANDLMTKAERQTALERISIRYTLDNLRTFPWIESRERQGLLSLHGAWFSIENGELWVMNKKTGDFARVEV